ncbi:MAG: DUF4870 domain-containing protein [bacterium]
MMKKDTVLGIGENLEAVLCYVGFWITGIIFLAIEKENNFVRFHALQSLIVFLGIFIVSVVASIIPLLGALIGFFITPISIVLWLFLMFKTFQGEKYKLPYIGDYVEQHINNIDNSDSIVISHDNFKTDKENKEDEN